jgi:hypothetical protein
MPPLDHDDDGDRLARALAAALGIAAARAYDDAMRRQHARTAARHAAAARRRAAIEVDAIDVTGRELS